MAQAVAGGQISGNGKFTKLCQQWLQSQYGLHKVLLTHSATAALEMAALLLEIGPEDEVILPSFTFVSTANAFALRGARLRFCDIREDTLNIDESAVEALINERTKAIVPVHYAGVGCEMDELVRISHTHRVPIVEDAAQAVSSKYKGKNLGGIGELGCFSFHETKNYISGEGGALLINDPELVERAEIIWEKGTNRQKFFRGQVDKYTWVDLGSSFLPSDLIAAFLYAQLEHSDEINRNRHLVHQRYREGLESLEKAGYLRLPIIPGECEHNAHLFYVLLPSADLRDQLLRWLTEQKVIATFHYIPLHNSPMGLRYAPDQHELPVTESISSRILRLPCFYGMSEEDSLKVIGSIQEFFEKRG